MAQGTLKILLIEPDDGFSRYVGEMMGQARDLSAKLAGTPDLGSALSVLDRQDFDAVLLDIAAPDGAGLGNIPVLKAKRPQLPIIAAGESDDETVALEALHAGAHDYLVKGQLTPGWLERSLRYAMERHRMDMVLRNAEEKYHGLFDHLVEGIFQTTEDGRYLMANTALARIYGYNSPDELMSGITDIGRRLYVQEDRRREFMRQMQENDTITAFESQIFRKDGTVIWISENCRAIRDSVGRLLYYEGTVEDITQRRHAEEKLRHSQALYHSLVETLPQNIFRKDVMGRFTFANQHFCRILGRTLEEIIGRTDADFFPPELARKYKEDDRKVLTTGTPYETVEEHQAPGHDKMYVQVVKTPIYSHEREVMGLQGIFWDITKERVAQEELQRAYTLLARSREELQIRNTQMENDLRMARQIQLTMLPQQYPHFGAPTEASTLQFAHRYLPTDAVGGDFFSVSALSEKDAAVFLCDVAGHGVQSSLVTAMIRALVEELKPAAADPGEFLTRLNNDLQTILKDSETPLLTTAIYAVANAQTGEIRYANAGHPKPLHIRRGRKEVVPLLNASGVSQPALGFMEGFAYQSSTTKLEPGDLLMLFTDGLYEVQDKKGEFYSPALLARQVQERLRLPAGALFDQLIVQMGQLSAEGGFTDDVCLVGMEYAAA